MQRKAARTQSFEPLPDADLQGYHLSGFPPSSDFGATSQSCESAFISVNQRLNILRPLRSLSSLAAENFRVVRVVAVIVPSFE